MAFYQCPKCKRVWQYPIEKCPDCFLNLERIKSKKIKVIGVSKVQIQTMFHPKTPYFVLLLEDENGNKWVQKSIEEYKIGDEFKIETSEDKNAVSIWRIKYDILEAFEKVTELLGGVNVNENSKILILPTLVSPTHSYLAENTSPEFLKAMIQYLIEIGARTENIKVTAQSFNEFPVEASAQKSQLLKVCQELKVLPVNLAEKNFLKKGDLEISEEVFSADLILNLPILKMGKAQASENLFKLLKKENYSAQKYLSSDEEIFKKLVESLPKVLTIAETNSIQKPDGFIAHLGLVLASFNPLNLDRIFFEITMGKNLPEILEGIKIENIPIVGREIEEVKFDVEKYG
jgi:uncharacterized protein (DUF362 family)